MKRLRLLAGLVVAGCLSAPALAQDFDYPENAAVTRAEAKAKAAAGPCETELKAGRSGAACKRYHEAVLDALSREHRRFQWCNVRMSEQSNVHVPPACLAGQTEMGIGRVIGLERKVSPKTWKAFDDQMARFSN